MLAEKFVDSGFLAFDGGCTFVEEGKQIVFGNAVFVEFVKHIAHGVIEHAHNVGFNRSESAFACVLIDKFAYRHGVQFVVERLHFGSAGFDNDIAVFFGDIESGLFEHGNGFFRLFVKFRFFGFEHGRDFLVVEFFEFFRNRLNRSFGAFVQFGQFYAGNFRHIGLNERENDRFDLIERNTQSLFVGFLVELSVRFGNAGISGCGVVFEIHFIPLYVQCRFKISVRHDAAYFLVGFLCGFGHVCGKTEMSFKRKRAGCVLSCKQLAV